MDGAQRRLVPLKAAATTIVAPSQRGVSELEDLLGTRRKKMAQHAGFSL